MTARYTAAELTLLAAMMAREASQREQDRELKRQKACPTFMRDLGRGYGDGIDCSDLANRLRQHADEAKVQEVRGPYRG